MLDRLHIRGFQSLYEVDLELSPFTVFVGPSNSGKSAVVRALRLLSENSRTGDVLSDGMSATSIDLYVDGSKVLYQRDNKGVRYVVDDDVYTKLANSVPDSASAILQTSDLTFASQFALPFLLDASGAVVARQFGELTNVTRVLEAAREGNRRKLASRASIKTRQEDLTAVQQRLSEFDGLQVKLEAQARAEASFEEAEAIASKVGRLNTLLSDLDAAVKYLNAQKSAVKVVLPSLDEVVSVNNRIGKLSALVSGVSRQLAAISTAKEAAKAAAAAVDAAKDEYATLLRELGTCPTCNQRIDGE